MTPYVYKITHKETGYYYIGSKYAGWHKHKNVTELIGEDYYTKSTDKFIKERFTKERVADWDIKIIYRTRGDEYDSIAEAVAHENLFIYEALSLKDGLCLNRQASNPLTNKHIWIFSEYTDEHRAKLEKGVRRYWGNLTPEERQARAVSNSRGMKGKTGKTLSPEQKAKISAAKKGRKVTAETRAKMSASSPIKGKKRTPEINAKVSAGVKRAHAQRTPEQKAEISKKLSEANRRRHARRRLEINIKNLKDYIDATK